MRYPFSVLLVPKTFLPLWSDYEPLAINTSAILNAFVNDSPALSGAKIDADGILRHGIESEWTLRHLGKTTVRLRDHCTASGRHFANLSVRQEVDPYEVLSPIEALTPRPSMPPWLKDWLSAEKPSPGKRSPRFPSFVANSAKDGDLVLVDAPISITERNEECPVLCDYPIYVRRPDDAAIPMKAPAAFVEKLKSQLGRGASWTPFCRSLGILRSGVQTQSLEVLEISFCVPRRPEAMWANQLSEEARDWSFRVAWKEDSVYLKDGLGRYRLQLAQAFSRHPGVSRDQLADEAGSELAHDLLEDNLLADHWIKQFEHNPYEGTVGFWIALATFLPAYSDIFAMSRAEISGLLRQFDETFDQAWSTLLLDLQISGLFRFTPSAMAQVRTRIAEVAPR